MHTIILQGTQTGGADPEALNLSFYDSADPAEGQYVVFPVVLEYVATASLTLDIHTNAPEFYDVELGTVVVTELTLDLHTNPAEYFNTEFINIPFDPENDETEDLIAAFDQEYGTTAKRQMDRLISLFKTGGQWAKFDWYGNALWAMSEHDALINWKNPTETLVKVGTASWTLGSGLSGANPATVTARYKSGYTIGAGNATSTSFCMLAAVTAIAAPQNDMQVMGMFRRTSGGGPIGYDGSFIQLNVISNTGAAGANVQASHGNTSFGVGDGLGLWGTSHNGGTHITVHNAAEVDADATSGSATYTHAEGICVAGTPPGLGAQRSFAGTILFWAWGAAMSAAELSGVQTALATAQLPPDVEPVEVQVPPAYTEPGGTGDRRADIILSWDVNVPGHNKTPADLIDGNTTTTPSALFFEPDAQPQQFIFDFAPLGFTQLIEEFKWYQDSTSTHGTWQVAGSDDGITWTDIDGPFTLGGFTPVQTKMLVNTTSYRMYRFLKTSGTTSNGPYLFEIEFKLGGHRAIAEIPVYATNTPGAIAVTATGGLINGTIAHLVNGNRTESDTYFNGGFTAAELVFDFGIAVAVAEATLYQDASTDHGRWMWQGSNDNVSYTNLSPFSGAVADLLGTPGSANNRAHRAFGGNTTPYRYYKCKQLTGTTSNGPWVREFEFRKYP